MPKGKVQTLNTTSKTIDVDKIKLNLKNPRLHHIDTPLSQKAIEEILWDQADAKSLYKQIRAAGGLHESPVLWPDYRVIEGNRRITCLKILKREAHEGKISEFPPTHFDKVPCEVVVEGTTEEQVALYLAAIHVKGKQPWKAFNKAAEIYILRNEYNKTLDELAETLGMGKATVLRMSDAYEETKKYRERFKDKKWWESYTYFDELFKKRELKDWRKLKENRNKFAEWVSKNKFNDDVRYVRYLPQILEDEDAMRIFERKSMNEAIQIIDTKDPSRKSRHFKKIKEMITLLRAFPRPELARTVDDPSRLKMLESLKKEVQNLLNDIKKFEKQ